MTHHDNTTADSVEKLMRTALRPCYIHGQLDQIRNKRGDTVTMGEAFTFKGDGRNSWYVQRLAGMSMKKQQAGETVQKAVTYLLEFAKRACTLYNETDLDALIPRFLEDYKKAESESKQVLMNADATAIEGWASFLSV